MEELERVTFLVDGFNLYHSLRSASIALGLDEAGTKWLDLAALCRSYLHLFGRSARLHEIHEEKETDVALGSKLLELFITDSCDRAVVITGDTDIAPAVRTAKRLFPAEDCLFRLPIRSQE